MERPQVAHPGRRCRAPRGNAYERWHCRAVEQALLNCMRNDHVFRGDGGTGTLLVGTFSSRLPPAVLSRQRPLRASPSRGAVRGLASRGRRGPRGGASPPPPTPPARRCRPPAVPASAPQAGQWPLQPSSRILGPRVYLPPALCPAARPLPISSHPLCQRVVSTWCSALSSFVTSPFESCAHFEGSSVILVFSCRTSLFIQDTSPLSDVLCKHFLLVCPCLFVLL